MCGIVGVLSFSPTGLLLKDVSIFGQLHKAVTLRGEHGAGLFWVGDDGTGSKSLRQQNETVYSSWMKYGGTPYELYATEEFRKEQYKINLARFIVGHVRYATHGKINTDNAHPFQVDHITLVHNGVIDAIKEKKDFKKFVVDSHALCDALAKDDPPNFLK